MTLSQKLKSKNDKSPHLIIEARAGTGKTTTLIEGLKLLKGEPSKFIPSDQQRHIWQAIQKSREASSACFVAFNKSIATELQKRVPKGCDAMTMHSMGFRAVRDAFELKPFPDNINDFRVQDIISEILGKDIREIRRKDSELLKATEKLVSLCKMNLIDLTMDATCNEREKDSFILNLQHLVSYYDVELNGNASRVFDLVPKVLERCKDVTRDGCIDFSDMIWLPVVLDLPIQKYDLLLVDEAQDLNRCQQQLAMKVGNRLILCGDPKQAIYGFAGADSESMDRMYETLEITARGCEVLPLTVTRRCGRAIVKEAQKYVPDFHAHESNCNGLISTNSIEPRNCPHCMGSGVDPEAELMEKNCPRCFGSGQSHYQVQAQAGDMILCRVNAPLVSECFKFLRAGRKAVIQGRDIGQGLVSTIKKVMKGYQPSAPVSKSVPVLILCLSDWLHKETAKHQNKPNPSEANLIALQDRYDCLLCFCEDQTTVQGVIDRIEKIFTDDKNGDGIKLSSIHKAKGLEADRVFLLQPEGATIPHPMARTAWQQEQEYNCLYIAITRARKELVYVS